jgi:tRNA (adenine57-N1/adenine58-N1)-methyltransferase catalytic subunit
MSRPLRAGERIVLVDSKRRRYLITLNDGGEFHSHSGVLAHNDLIGNEEGITGKSTGGGRYTAIRPTLAEFVLKMPRGAQVIYPKDLGPILFLADVFPGARILESGVGSGALSMTLLRAGADVVGYELREDFAKKAQQNVSAFLGEEAMSRYRVEVRNAYDGIDETGLDRVVLDLPEPWNVVPHAAKALRSGGIIVAYLPTINQTAQFRRTLNHHGFSLAETVEVLHRGWHIEGMSVRPDHRMVAHTGFLTHARLLPGESALKESSVAPGLGFATMPRLDDETADQSYQLETFGEVDSDLDESSEMSNDPDPSDGSDTSDDSVS